VLICSTEYQVTYWLHQTRK